MTSRAPVKVTIFDNTQGEKCEGHCGIDFSAPGTFDFVKAHLSKVFGDAVKLEYLDLADSSVSRSHPDIVEMLRGRDLLLPLLFVNGKLRVSGYFDIYLLQNVIQTETEMEQGYD